MSDTKKKETFGGTVGFVFIICLACAALVSIAAVGLKPLQTANKLLDKQTKILEASGLLAIALKAENIKALGGESKSIVDTYGKYVDAKMISLATGKVIEGNVKSFDERADARDVSKSSKPENDIAGINRQADNAVVYLIKDEQGKVSTIVLPIIGSGLWDLMYGFVGLESDLNTVKSVIYSDLKETPGLGAEVLNPKWKALWPGKKMFDEQGNIAIQIVKGGAKTGDVYGVDALSGATLTSNGVENTLHFWLGKEGYGPFITNYRAGELN
jgi:Na+-transporting NADH:ubiquinone oxidoreductase subunit C